MATDNNMQFIPSNNLVQTDQPKSGVVTHQPLPSYGQIYTETMQSQNQNPTIPVYMYQNSQMIPVPCVNNGMSGRYPAVRYPAKGRDYFNIIWSSFNILCCGCLLGIIALVLSIVALKMRRDGNDQSVRCFAIWAAIINGIATIGGIIFIIILSINFYN